MQYSKPDPISAFTSLTRSPPCRRAPTLKIVFYFICVLAHRASSAGGSQFSRVPHPTSLGWALEAGRLGEAKRVPAGPLFFGRHKPQQRASFENRCGFRNITVRCAYLENRALYDVFQRTDCGDLEGDD